MLYHSFNYSRPVFTNLLQPRAVVRRGRHLSQLRWPSSVATDALAVALACDSLPTRFTALTRCPTRLPDSCSRCDSPCDSLLTPPVTADNSACHSPLPRLAATRCRLAATRLRLACTTRLPDSPATRCDSAVTRLAPSTCNSLHSLQLAAHSLQLATTRCQLAMPTRCDCAAATPCRLAATRCDSLLTRCNSLSLVSLAVIAAQLLTRCDSLNSHATRCHSLPDSPCDSLRLAVTRCDSSATRCSLRCQLAVTRALRCHSPCDSLWVSLACRLAATRCNSSVTAATRLSLAATRSPLPTPLSLACNSLLTRANCCNSLLTAVTRPCIWPLNSLNLRYLQLAATRCIVACHSLQLLNSLSLAVIACQLAANSLQPARLACPTAGRPLPKKPADDSLSLAQLRLIALAVTRLPDSLPILAETRCDSDALAANSLSRASNSARIAADSPYHGFNVACNSLPVHSAATRCQLDCTRLLLVAQLACNSLHSLSLAADSPVTSLLTRCDSLSRAANFAATGCDRPLHSHLTRLQLAWTPCHSPATPLNPLRLAANPLPTRCHFAATRCSLACDSLCHSPLPTRCNSLRLAVTRCDSPCRLALPTRVTRCNSCHSLSLASLAATPVHLASRLAATRMQLAVLACDSQRTALRLALPHFACNSLFTSLCTRSLSLIYHIANRAPLIYSLLLALPTRFNSLVAVRAGPVQCHLWRNTDRLITRAARLGYSNTLPQALRRHYCDSLSLAVTRLPASLDSQVTRCQLRCNSLRNSRNSLSPRTRPTIASSAPRFISVYIRPHRLIYLLEPNRNTRISRWLTTLLGAHPVVNSLSTRARCDSLPTRLRPSSVNSLPQLASLCLSLACDIAWQLACPPLRLRTRLHSLPNSFVAVYCLRVIACPLCCASLA
ncbi:unnamed protein product [Pleuronectes platessa]|uniref:Uncharacterized protein n=1 Tax=Pleuronectes platessa TaxID=8262 RepID=A0A9N7USI7_PLEPL|nr:unnamed protein product [Pleuronectes platessa]